MLERTHKRSTDNQLCVLWSLHGLPRQSCSPASPRLQLTKHATIGKHLVDWTVSKYLDTNVVFQRDISLILLIINKQNQKPVTAFPEFIYVTINMFDVFVSNYWRNCLNFCLLFIHWFSHAKSGNCKKLLHWPTQIIQQLLSCDIFDKEVYSFSFVN